MSRPRKPFGAQHPGRLPATMMKVLAAEMSDPARLRRGKQYAKDGSVLDIVIEPGTVTCEIQGSRATPYVATVVVSPGDGMPLRRDVSTTCTCPDDDNWDGHACKHVVAAMFTFSDELLLEPELLDVWRDRASTQPEGERRHLRLVRDPERDRVNRDRSHDAADDLPADPPADPLRGMLGVPDGAVIPEIGVLDDVDPAMPVRGELAAVLRDSLAHVRVIWD